MTWPTLRRRQSLHSLPDEQIGRQSGFVLPMTLVVVAIIGLSLWAAMSVLDGMRRDLTALTEGLRLETAAQRAEARVLHAILSEPAGSLGVRVNGRRISRAEEFGLEVPALDDADARGLGEGAEVRPLETWIRFDGAPYRLAPADPTGMSVVVSIQDDAGLFDLNTVNEDAASRYVQSLGLAEAQARNLAGALADFVDQDDLRRLNGAEEPEYRQAGLPPPPNAFFTEVAEVWGVMGWREQLSPAQRRRVGETATSALMFSLSNINTASREVLRAWFGLTDEEAEAVMEARALQPLLAVNDITRITGVDPQIDDLRLYTFPSRRIRLRVWPESGALASKTWETWLTRSEFAADRPYYRGRSSLLDTSAIDSGSPGGSGDQRERHGELQDLPQAGRLPAE
jgi:hypothetical protein